MRKFGVLTGGGDCPGLNAVIRAVAKTLINEGCEVYGFKNGFNGLINNNYVLLDNKYISGILPRGGTILGSTNRDNPFQFAIEDEKGEFTYVDRSAEVKANIENLGLEALVVIGGDGSLAIAGELSEKCGVNVVGCPKTIDNDLLSTERTFGFDTAVAMATEAVDRLHTTAESHHRVMILEVMGRYAGWIALHCGIAGGADAILIPEIPYKLESVVDKIKRRAEAGKDFSIVVVAEGAKPLGGDISIGRIVKGSFEQIRLGGAGEKVSRIIEDATGLESRCTVLGYLQRGGTPTAFDRVLCTRYGVAAAECVLRKEYNVMVSLSNDHIVPVEISKVAGKNRCVELDNELLNVARKLNICLGE